MSHDSNLLKQMASWYAKDNPKPFQHLVLGGRASGVLTSFLSNYHCHSGAYMDRFEKFLDWLQAMDDHPRRNLVVLDLLYSGARVPGVALRPEVYTRIQPFIENTIFPSVPLTQKYKGDMIAGSWMPNSTWWLYHLILPEPNKMLQFLEAAYAQPSHCAWPILFSKENASHPMLIALFNMEHGRTVLAKHLPKKPLALLRFCMARMHVAPKNPHFGTFHQAIEQDRPEWKAFSPEDWMLTRCFMKSVPPTRTATRLNASTPAPVIALPTKYQGLAMAMELGADFSTLKTLLHAIDLQEPLAAHIPSHPVDFSL